MTNDIKIDAKFFAVISGVIVFLVVTIFLLNQVDSKNKESQIDGIYNIVENSPYKNKLGELISDFDTANVAIIKEIAKTVNAISEEKAIDYCTLYLNTPDSFYVFRLNSYDEKGVVTTRKDLPIQDKKVISAYKKSSVNMFSELYEINKNESLIEVYNIIYDKNDHMAYLISKKERK